MTAPIRLWSLSKLSRRSLSSFSSKRTPPFTSKPTPWNINVVFGLAKRTSPARNTTFPMESTLPTLCVVRRKGIDRSTLYAVIPCMTEPPGVEISSVTSATRRFAHCAITAIKLSTVLGLISAKNDTTTCCVPGGTTTPWSAIEFPLLRGSVLNGFPCRDFGRKLLRQPHPVGCQAKGILIRINQATIPEST